MRLMVARLPSSSCSPPAVLLSPPSPLQSWGMATVVLFHTKAGRGLFRRGCPWCPPQPRRSLRVSPGGWGARDPPGPGRARERVEIPGLDLITYEKRMHYVPGLSKPAYKQWQREYKDPRFYVSPPPQDMSLHKDRPCYIYNQRTSALEGTRHRAWLSTVV